MTDVDVVFSFDTTGSMYPCLTEVRRDIKEIVQRLFKEIPGIRIGIIAHGDYCDEDYPYLMKMQDLTTDQSKIIQFVNNVDNTNGGDEDEAYEYVLREVQKMSWQSGGVRALVMIADAYPHTREKDKYRIDWQEEIKKLSDMAVTIYSVQCLNRKNPLSRTFFTLMAKITNGYHLQLAQFSYIADIMMAICFKQGSGNDRVLQYEQELIDQRGGRLASGVRSAIGVMVGREITMTDDDFDRRYSTNPEDIGDLRPCPPSKFQIVHVDTDGAIKQFVENVLRLASKYKAGRGFYEFTKREEINARKEIVLMDKETGELFEGRRARVIAGIPIERDVTMRPADIEKYVVFVQSTSYNRKLIAGTRFLYETSV